MADRLCAGDSVGDVIEKTSGQEYDNAMDGEIIDSENGIACENVNTFYISSESDKLFNKLCASNRSKHEEYLACEDDCRKKRCVDRYDSSESSDSGVAALSCTDCSGSSTASSDITDPGSPFSTASSHSEDSASQPAKMPPTQTAHHPPWPWTADGLEGPRFKRSLPDKTAFGKRLKPNIEDSSNKQSPSCLNKTKTSSKLVHFSKTVDMTSPINNNTYGRNRKMEVTPKMQQGKITEYFKSQVKSNGLKKDFTSMSKQKNNKLVSLVDQKTLVSINKSPMNRNDMKTSVSVAKKPITVDAKSRKFSSGVPRKILPAPSKIPEKISVNNQLNNVRNFPSTVTLTAVSFPPNMAYLHTKAPKPPDNMFVPQFTTITPDKINAFPIISRSPCLNVIQPLQKLTTVNNFSCVKLNATVVPILKLNALPTRLNGLAHLSNVAVSVETAGPTVISVKSKLPNETSIMVPNSVTPKQQSTPLDTLSNNTIMSQDNAQQFRNEEKPRIEEERRLLRQKHSERTKEKPPSPSDSDSGISNKDCLEVNVSEPVTVDQQKSPILSQPKTIRFPAKKQNEDFIGKEQKSSPQLNDGQCRWKECNAQYETSGALLEHLQVKHVISQASQERYVCLWMGCKVHGRTSCSRSWLERHVLAHAGTKPFRCIVDGCGQRFNSQLTLERHVNGHFNSDGTPNHAPKKSADNNTSAKLFKRNGRIIRFRRQPWSARMFDFIDSGIMEGLQFKLLTMSERRTSGKINSPGDTVNLQSKIVARQTHPDGHIRLLLKWYPEDVVPDEWVYEKEYRSSKVVQIPFLHPSSKNALHPLLFPSIHEKSVGQKQRRKPSKQTT